MRARLLVAAAAGIAVLGISSPALANQTININPGNIGPNGTTAASWPENKGCEPFGQSATQDGWVFILPGGSGEFVSVTATFRKLDGTTTTVTSTNKTTDNGKADKVWMQTPVGWALIQPTTAVVTDDAKSDKFNLTHTCAAGGGSTPTPTPTGTKPTTPTPTPSTSASTTATPSSPGATPSGTKPAESTPAPTGSTTVPPVTEPSGGNLPTTGIALTGLFAAAGAALAAGLFMRSVRRRRVETVLPE